MDIFATRKTSGAACRQPGECPSKLLAEYQALIKKHDAGNASYRKEWEIALYKPGDIRKDKPLKDGALFYRHIPCRAEYGISNLARTHEDHCCQKVSFSALKTT